MSSLTAFQVALVMFGLGAWMIFVPWLMSLRRQITQHLDTKETLARLQCEQTRLEIDTLKRANEPIPIHLKQHEPGKMPQTFVLYANGTEPKETQSTG